MEGLIEQSEDSVILFTNKIGYNMDKHILGKERMSTDSFLEVIVVDVTILFEYFLFIHMLSSLIYCYTHLC